MSTPLQEMTNRFRNLQINTQGQETASVEIDEPSTPPAVLDKANFTPAQRDAMLQQLKSQREEQQKAHKKAVRAQQEAFHQQRLPVRMAFSRTLFQ